MDTEAAADDNRYPGDSDDDPDNDLLHLAETTSVLRARTSAFGAVGGGPFPQPDVVDIERTGL
jgi:hypothetical protein